MLVKFLTFGDLETFYTNVAWLVFILILLIDLLF